ncbi:MAG: 6-carboxytetrahydropterin synthase [Gemmatimonadales bacterium]
MAASLSRVVGFRAQHRFFRPDWSEARNREAFGPLTDAPGHAHDYHCLVTVRGPLETSRGMVMDLGLLDRILGEQVVVAFDGRHLNLDVPEFAYGRTLPTCEAIAAHVFTRVAAELPAGVTLERVRILEDPTLYGDCTEFP